MAKMYPSTADKIKYHGEKLIFERFRDCNFLNGYSVFHSLSILSHNTKSEGEADFVFVGPHGIFVLEVKGSTKIIANSEGPWVYYDGDEYYKKESPFNQAKSNLYSITSNLSKKLRINVGLKRGYGVAFPKLQFERESIEWNKDIIIDSNNINDFDKKIMSLIDYWRKESNLSDWDQLSNDEIKQISDYLRGDFIAMEGTRTYFDRTIRIINTISEEQLESLEYLVSFKSVLINGLPGTGKTLLAKKIARVKASEGSNVLFLCFNRILSIELKSELSLREKNITVTTIDSLVYGILSVNYNRNEIPEEFPARREQLRAALLNNDFAIENFDYIVIDEGQDFLDLTMLEILGYLIKGGLESGKYAIFYDDTVQDALYGAQDLKITINRLSQLTGNKPIKLHRNFRNPLEIVIKTGEFTSLPIPECAIPSSPDNVKISYYSNQKDQIDKLFIHINYLFNAQNIHLNRMILLKLSNQADPVIEGLNELLKKENIGRTVDLSFLYDQEQKGKFELNKRDLPFCTIHAFKGMESDFVVIPDIEKLEEMHRVLLYIGMTRARVSTLLMCKDTLSDKIKKEL